MRRLLIYAHTCKNHGWAFAKTTQNEWCRTGLWQRKTGVSCFSSIRNEVNLLCCGVARFRGCTQQPFSLQLRRQP